MSTVQNVRNITTNGLVLFLDAANPKSYVSGSTIWNDLTLNQNTTTLVNGPTYSSAFAGGVVFDAVDDYGSVTSTASDRLRWANYWTGTSANQMTIICVITADFSGFVSIRDGIIGQQYYYGLGFSFEIHCNANSNPAIPSFNIGSNANFQQLSGPNWSAYTNTPVFISMTHDGTTRAINYSLNNTFYSTLLPQVVSGGTYMSDVTNNLQLVQYTSAGPFRNKTIHYLSVYNRVLSNSEVSQIYNSVRGRFKLP
jgi:hypothetical protein